MIDLDTLGAVVAVAVAVSSTTATLGVLDPRTATLAAVGGAVATIGTMYAVDRLGA